jgi:hypothetical protein
MKKVLETLLKSVTHDSLNELGIKTILLLRVIVSQDCSLFGNIVMNALMEWKKKGFETNILLAKKIIRETFKNDWKFGPDYFDYLLFPEGVLLPPLAYQGQIDGELLTFCKIYLPLLGQLHEPRKTLSKKILLRGVGLMTR